MAAITQHSVGSQLSLSVLMQAHSLLRFPQITYEGKKALLTADGAAYTEQFKSLCRRKYFTMSRAWRLLLDSSGNGRVSFVSFCNAARSMGFANVNTLWKHLDTNKTGFITLELWDKEAHRNIMEFRQICMREFGDVDYAFRYGMDVNGSGTVDLGEMKAFLDNYSFSGDLKVLWGALDENHGGFITLDELDFLTYWEGERFEKKVVEQQPALARTRLQMGKRRQQDQEAKVLRELQRQEREAEMLREQEQRQGPEVQYASEIFAEAVLANKS